MVASALVTLPSCCLPKLHKACPAPPLPDTYLGGVDCENSSHIVWCAFYEDPQLVGLIGDAIVGNQELRILNEDIRIANNEILSRRGELFPFLSFGGRASLDKSSEYTPLGAAERQLTAPGGVNFPDPLPDFMLATQVSWEIDIWKKLRNARDAASLRYLATREGRNYTVTRLVAEVAETYYELLALDNRLAILDRQIEIQQQTLKTAEAMKESARATELAVQRFEAEVRKNQSERNIILQEIIERENHLNFLVGRFPQPIQRNKVDYVNLQLSALSAGVPSQMLQNRADIRQAELELRAAGLDVRVARARFYPSLNLSAGVGYRAFNTRYLFNSPESLIYNVGGDLVAPLINRAAIKADYMSANAVQLQRIYDYQRTVLNAFVEVINSLSKVHNYGQSIELKKQQLAALEASVDSATNLFQNARVEYMEVLLAQRDLMEARMTIVRTKEQQLAAIVNAYQALGGGVPSDQCPGGFGQCCPLPTVSEWHEAATGEIPAGEFLPPDSTPMTQPAHEDPAQREMLPPPAASNDLGVGSETTLSVSPDVSD
jgi:multidrug efflux system outer membrane protein